MSQVVKRAAGVAASVAVLMAGVAVSASPAHAAAYTVYKNSHSGTCLTAGKAGTVFVSACNGSAYQQWAVGAGDQFGYYQVKNRASGQCLTTDYKNNVNAVWTDGCKVTRGQLWEWGGPTGEFVNRDLESFLRTSPRAGAVYSDIRSKHPDDLPDWSYFDWHLG